MAISYDEYPAKADLVKDVYQPLPFIPPGTVNPAPGGEEATQVVTGVLHKVNAALISGDNETLQSCFWDDQAFWRDIIALTSHLRTFSSPAIISKALLATKALRGLSGGFQLKGPAKFIPVTPVLQFIECWVDFKTSSPAASCLGRLFLLPIKVDDGLTWRIWILTTMIENLDVHPVDQTLLQRPADNFQDRDRIETPVFIIGGGNAAIMLASRLKALGVESVMADKNPNVGDNWMNRYDCLRLHLPTASCEMPYLSYKEFQTPHRLSRDEVAEETRRYVSTFGLNIITSVELQSTEYDEAKQLWTLKLKTPYGQKTVVTRQLVQATGIGSDKPYVPDIAQKQLYKGVNVHSAHYKNAKLLAERGVKSVLVVGSANTAFDIIKDCYHAGLKTTMVVRSPTLILPTEYVDDVHSLGAFEVMSADAAEKQLFTLPNQVEGLLMGGLFGHLASLEPDRYKALADAGFPVMDSSHPDADMEHCLIERAGGHYVDTGDAVPLIAEGKVSVKALVEPVAYTATGLRFSDDSTADADAVVWCTGFADHNARATAAQILGGPSSAPGTADGDGTARPVLGPEEIAARLDATWGVDIEGEIRGLWKRHLRMENYWVMGGNLQLQRWNSRALSQQIKLALEGILPPAYRETP